MKMLCIALAVVLPREQYLERNGYITSPLDRRHYTPLLHLRESKGKRH